MGSLQVFLVCVLDDERNASAALGMAFVAGPERRFSPFKSPLIFEGLFDYAGPVAETSDGTLVGLVDVARALSSVAAGDEPVAVCQ